MEGLDRDKEVESVMVVETPPSKGVTCPKRKREVEELSSPSADAVSEKKNLRETAPVVLTRWKMQQLQQGQLRTKEAGRGGERDGGLDESGNGREFQTSEGEHEKGFDECTNVGSGCRQRMDLERAPDYWEPSGLRSS